MESIAVISWNTFIIISLVLYACIPQYSKTRGKQREALPTSALPCYHMKYHPKEEKKSGGGGEEEEERNMCWKTRVKRAPPSPPRKKGGMLFIYPSKLSTHSGKKIGEKQVQYLKYIRKICLVPYCK